MTYSVAYLHHLFRARELLAYRLASIHNLRFMQRVMESIRVAIESGTFWNEMQRFLERYHVANANVAHEQKRKWATARKQSKV